jgi:hypothetical protein
MLFELIIEYRAFRARGRWSRVCTGGDAVPGSVGEALGMLESSLD